jgi:hypothetical protein
MQTAYTTLPALGVPGMPATDGLKVVRSKIAAGTVRPGQYVVFDTNGKCAHPAAQPTAATRGGIALRNMYADSDGVYSTGQTVDVLIEGEVWVATETDVAMNGACFVRCVAGVGEELGALRKDADTSDAFSIPGLYFRLALGAAGISRLEVNHSAA